MSGLSRGSRSLHRRIGRWGGLLVLAALGAPAAASGDLLYVAPNDESAGFFCTQPQPCGIGIGITFATDDDEVLVGPGTYEASSNLEVAATAANVTIRPEDPPHHGR